MSGRGKRIAYYVVMAVCALLAVAATVLMLLPFFLDEGFTLELGLISACFIVVSALLTPYIALHEIGHLVFGACAKMRFISVKVGYLQFSTRGMKISLSGVRSGESKLLPVGEKRLKERMTAVALGGSVFNFLYGVTFCLLYFFLPYHPVLLFFQLFAPLQLFEGVCAILPAQLNTGRTDGEVVHMLQKNGSEAQIYLRVLQAQSILATGTYDDVPYSLLFDTPVVQEDDPAFLSLLHLRYQFCFWKGELEQAKTALSRLNDLREYLSEPVCSEVRCDYYCLLKLMGEEADFPSASVAPAKNTCAYLRAEYMNTQKGLSRIEQIILQEPAEGVRCFEKRYIQYITNSFQHIIEKNNSPEGE